MTQMGWGNDYGQFGVKGKWRVASGEWEAASWEWGRVGSGERRVASGVESPLTTDH
jgi:hypothetical protein